MSVARAMRLQSALTSGLVHLPRCQELGAD